MHYRIELFAPEMGETDNIRIFGKPDNGWRPTSVGDIADALTQFATALRMQPDRVANQSMKITRPETDGGNAIPIMVYSGPITE
jgi:hypothetical protein